MKHLLTLATTKLATATRRAAATARGSLDDEPATDDGNVILADGGDETAPAAAEVSDAADETDAPRDAETDAEALLYADDDEFEAAFRDEWPDCPGESLTWLVAEDESEPLLVAYDRDSESDDEFLQTPVRVCPDGGSRSAGE